MLEKIYNYWLLVKNFLTIKKYGNYTIPDNYVLYSSDDFSSDKFWIKSQYYGPINTEYHWQYCSEDCVKFSKDGLKLIQKYNKRITDYWDNKRYETTFDVGAVTSKKSFKYGIYEFNVIFPKGKYLWPAIWLCGKESWPPEIDIVEGYSDGNGNYKNRFNSNIHYGTNDNHLQIGAMKTIRYDINKEYNFKLVFTSKEVTIYVNNFKVRSIKDKKILDELSKNTYYLILNTAVQKDYKGIENQVSTFIIKDFYYYIDKSVNNI